MPITEQPDMTRPIDCNASPCACPDRGPPDYSRATSAKHAPSSSEDVKTAIDRANYFRTAMGLAAFNGADLINKAAQAHSDYLQNNKRSQCYPDTPHSEMDTCPGFTGVGVADRLTTAGYRFVANSEVINEGPLDPSAAVDNWIWSVYHRLPFVDYHLAEAGFGVSSHWVMNFGTPVGVKTTAPTAPIVVPLPGETLVPVAFDGFTESPTPPAPGGGGPWPNGKSSGQVISIHFPTGSGTVTAHQLFQHSGDSCTPVAHTFFAEGDDPNLAGSHAAFLYADDPLADNTEYVVHLKGTWKQMDFDRTWAFTTQ